MELKHFQRPLKAYMLGGILVVWGVHLIENHRLFGDRQEVRPVPAHDVLPEDQEQRPRPAAKFVHETPLAQTSTPYLPPVSAESLTKPVRNRQPLPGTFRGDWGPLPVYAKNDRVNYERGAYLSLEDGNQNQPPASSSGYWRLVKKFRLLHEENCFNPSPGADIGECDFSISANSLKDRDLRNANLVKARLDGELGSADLSGANLSGAAVLGKLVIGPDTRLAGANLSYLQSDGNNPVIAEHANLSEVNFGNANLYGAKFAHADLTKAKLTETVLTGSDLASADLREAVLEKADMSYANLAESKLTLARMNNANFEQADLHQADLSQAHLRQANFAGAQLAGINLSGADLHGANLSSAQGAESAVIDNQTDFTTAICPDGVMVDGTQVTTCVGHGF